MHAVNNIRTLHNILTINNLNNCKICELSFDTLTITNSDKGNTRLAVRVYPILVAKKVSTCNNKFVKSKHLYRLIVLNLKY